MHADSTSGREPFVSVSTEPLMGSRFGHMVGKIPLLRRLGKPAKVAAPVPLSQVQPNLKKMPGNQRLDRAVSVDVKVNVAESGVVRHAEVVEYGDPPNWTLAAAALSAARRWTFEPARMEDTAVAAMYLNCSARSRSSGAVFELEELALATLPVIAWFCIFLRIKVAVCGQRFIHVFS